MSTPNVSLYWQYHDASEVLTGDLPTPVKYSIRKSLRSTRLLKKSLSKKSVNMVPEELRDIFAPLIDEHAYSDEEKSLVKQADALCAYLKCLEELAAGNDQFLLAKTRLEATLEARRSQEMDYFMEVFVPASIFRSMRLARIHRCKRRESASHQAISAGCDIRLLSKRKQHRDHHHTNRHHDNGERYPQLHKVTEVNLPDLKPISNR